MNYLFYTQCLTPEQASRLLCNLGIYKVEHLKTVPVTYKSYLIKRNNKKIFKDFYESFIAKAMKNIDVHLLDYQQHTFLLWDQFSELSKGDNEYDKMDNKKDIQLETFGKDSVWAEFDQVFRSLLEGDKYLPSDPDLTIEMEQQFYQWGDIILKVCHVVRKGIHLGTLLTLYYEPSLLLEYKFQREGQKESDRDQFIKVRLFAPVISLLFQGISAPSEIPLLLQDFQRKIAELLLFYIKYLREDKRSEVIRFDVVEHMITLYFLKKLTT